LDAVPETMCDAGVVPSTESALWLKSDDPDAVKVELETLSKTKQSANSPSWQQLPRAFVTVIEREFRANVNPTDLDR
jgi:hypothetical protein